MTDKETTYQLIDRFLLGEMTEQEKISFEQQLTEDSNLQKELNFEQSLHTSIVQASIEDLRNEVSHEIAGIKSQKAWKQKFLFAATTLLVIGGCILLFNREQEQNTEVNLSPPKKTDNQVQTEKLTEEKITKIKPIDTTEINSTVSNKKPQIVNEPIEPEAKGNNIIVENKETELSEETLETAAEQENTEKAINSTESSNNKTTDNPCSQTRVLLSYKTKKPCLGKDDGSVTLIATGGTEPYSYTINEEESTEYSRFDFLEAGEYTFTSTDGNGCPSDILKVTLTAEKCFEAPKAFNPDRNNWKHPLDDKSRTLTIYDPAGTLIYSVTDTKLTWTGKDMNGMDQPTDTYLYTIMEGGQLIDKNYITLVRE